MMMPTTTASSSFSSCSSSNIMTNNNNNNNSSSSKSNNNNNASNSRPPYAVSTRGSSFGAESNVADRWSSQNLNYIRQLWDLNDEQYRQLCLMKDKLADVDHWKNSPYEAIRFIMGPQGFDKAEELLRNMIAWRIDNDIDSILDEYKPPKILYDYLPSAILAGYDKDGDPIYLERGGAIDGHALLQRYGPERLQQHVIWSRELASRGRWIEEYEKVQGRPPTRLTIIYDLQGLNSRHLRSGVLPFLNEAMRTTQLRYNGLAKRMIIIRAPSLFNVVWNICKYAFPKGAIKKMVFSGPHNYLEVLDKYVDREVLPACIVPGGKGQVAIDMPPRLEGGLIPDDHNDIPLDEEEQVDAATICTTASSDGCGLSQRGSDGGGRWCYDSSTSLETTSDSDGDTTTEPVSSPSPSSSCGSQKRSSPIIPIRCKRITSGCWDATSSLNHNKKTSVIIRVFDSFAQ